VEIKIELLQQFVVFNQHFYLVALVRVEPEISSDMFECENNLHWERSNILNLVELERFIDFLPRRGQEEQFIESDTYNGYFVCLPMKMFG
jgi:hypothetical protein